MSELDDLALDDLKRDELPEMPKAVADTLDEWLWRMHGVMSGGHHVGVFLKWLKRNGYEVVADGAAIQRQERERLLSQLRMLPHQVLFTPSQIADVVTMFDQLVARPTEEEK